METTKKAYDEILKVLNKHKDLININIEDLETKAKLHLFGLELKENYGLNINPKEVKSTTYNIIGDYLRIYKVGANENSKISWSDDGRQPDNELLLNICFPTGAYIFGEDYATDFFQKFWNELKTYSPKYTDTTNKSLYYSMDNAKDVFNNFNDMLKKYYELNKEDAKQRRILKMKADLEKLENAK